MDMVPSSPSGSDPDPVFENALEQPKQTGIYPCKLGELSANMHIHFVKLLKAFLKKGEHIELIPAVAVSYTRCLVPLCVKSKLILRMILHPHSEYQWTTLPVKCFPARSATTSKGY